MCKLDMVLAMLAMLAPVVSIKRIELSAHVEQGALNLNFNFRHVCYGFKANAMHFLIMTESSQPVEHGGSLHPTVESLVPRLGAPDDIQQWPWQTSLGIDKNRIAVCAVANAFFTQAFKFVDESFLLCQRQIRQVAKFVRAVQ